MTDLGTVRGWERSGASHINNLGQVVGGIYNEGPDIPHAMLVNPEDTDGDGIPDRWYRDKDQNGENDLMIDLGAWGADLCESSAHGINDLGQVAGMDAGLCGYKRFYTHSERYQWGWRSGSMVS